MKKRVLVSLCKKEGSLDFIKRIQPQFDFISTGGSKIYLEESNIACIAVSEITQFEEIMDGRVKTLHPKIYAGLLARKNNQTDLATLKKLKLVPITMVLVNFYSFEEALKQNLTTDEILEFVDIGGPSMLRAAAKNYKAVIPIYDQKDYDWVADILEKGLDLSLQHRKKLAAKAFQYCSELDQKIANYLNQTETKIIKLQPLKKLRYGENPHQKAYLYQQGSTSFANLELLQGKQLSYNNYLDIYAALQIAAELKNFDKQTNLSVIIKHNNPCGLATDKDSIAALNSAWDGDPVSAFGSIIVVNQVNQGIVNFLLNLDKKQTNKKFFEILIAENYETAALNLLHTHSKAILIKNLFEICNKNEFRFLAGIVLEQEKDVTKETEFKLVTTLIFPAYFGGLIKFGILCCKYSKSNAICLVRLKKTGMQLIGSGFGQPNRLDSLLKLAIPKMKANLKREYLNLVSPPDYNLWYQQQLKNIILISDAFLPFPDLAAVALKNGLKYIVQPGGSKKDQDSIDFCNQNKMAMLFSGLRHFSH